MITPTIGAILLSIRMSFPFGDLVPHDECFCVTAPMVVRTTLESLSIPVAHARSRFSRFDYLVLTVHVQVDSPPTLALPSPPRLPQWSGCRVTLGSDDGQAPACAAGTSWPPVVTLPVRASLPSAVTVTVPPPHTVVGVVSHFWSLLTDQLQRASPPTFRSFEPASCGKSSLDGATLGGYDGHGGGAAFACSTVTVRSTMTMVPRRVCVDVFAVRE